MQLPWIETVSRRRLPYVLHDRDVSKQPYRFVQPAVCTQVVVAKSIEWLLWGMGLLWGRWLP